jgi:hypothetical protein
MSTDAGREKTKSIRESILVLYPPYHQPCIYIRERDGFEWLIYMVGNPIYLTRRSNQMVFLKGHGGGHVGFL